MSDPKPPYGEPIEEPTAVDDVVGRANEGLADAEAAGRDAVGDAPEATEAAAPAAEAVDAPPVDTPPVETASGDTASAADVPWYERDDVPFDDDAPGAVAAAPAAEPAITPSEPVAEQATELIPPAAVAPSATPAVSPQPIFVQAPEPPRPRGNRSAAGAIGLLAALVFAVLYLAAWLGVGLVDGSVTGDGLGAAALDALGTWALWVPTVVFFVAFWLLGAIINRGRWGHWVVFGLLVGVASYGGHILGQLFQAPFWELTAREGGELTEGQLLVPLAIAAFVIGRELTIWFGAWVAARGKRVSELNYEAQREYERTIEAGPAIVRQAQG